MIYYNPKEFYSIQHRRIEIDRWFFYQNRQYMMTSFHEKLKKEEKKHNSTPG